MHCTFLSSSKSLFLVSYHAVVLLLFFVLFVDDCLSETELISSGSRTSSGVEKRAPEPSPLTRRKTYDKVQAAADRAKVKEIKQ